MIHPYIYVGTFKKFMPLGKLTKEEILKVICRELQMDFDEVKNRKTRLKEFVYARQLYSYFCKEYTNESLKNMGKFIHKDHATMIHSINQIKDFYEVKNDVDISMLMRLCDVHEVPLATNYKSAHILVKYFKTKDRWVGKDMETYFIEKNKERS